MDAIHINWTKPFTNKTHRAFEAEDFELLTTILSALKWREKNGCITMVTDREGAEYYINSGLGNVWNEINVSLDNVDVNADVFWAAGKIFALSRQSAPIAMIDTDFILWERIDDEKLTDVTVIHFEDLYPHIYPPFEYFEHTDFTFEKDFDRSVKACNTALCIIKDDALLRYYTDTAIDFMRKTHGTDDRLKYMVFAEQRLLPICAKKLGKNISAFSDMKTLFSGNDTRFTHTWGMKQQMRDNDALRYDFCKRCIRRILTDFPKMESILRNIHVLSRYF